MKSSMTADFVRAALKEHFSSPKHAIVYEVARSTGAAARRRVDAVVMDLWPSRGLNLHGIEIKVSLSDWRRENANPEKAEELARLCDYFWVAAPSGLVPEGEVPQAWGLLEVSDRGGVSVVKLATKTECAPLDRPFMAAMLRAATRPVADGTLDTMLERQRADMEADFDRRVRARADHLTGKVDRDAVSWRRLVRALGQEELKFLDDQEIVDAVKLVWKSGALRQFSGLRYVHTTMRAAVDSLGKALENVGIGPDEPRRRRRRTRRTSK